MTDWTEDRVELLKKLWADGCTCSQIRNELGGTSRNAVIGKVRRLNLARRGTPPNPSASSTRKPRKPKSQPSRVGVTIFGRSPPLKPSDYVPLVPEPDPKVIPLDQRCTILDLTSTTCRWPIGVPGKPDFFFCGGKPHEGLPYCGYHSRIAYQPARAR
jgi:GcrA cell cycle regulator